MLEENKGLRGKKEKNQNRKKHVLFFLETTGMYLSLKICNCALCQSAAQPGGFQEAQV